MKDKEKMKSRIEMVAMGVENLETNRGLGYLVNHMKEMKDLLT